MRMKRILFLGFCTIIGMCLLSCHHKSGNEEKISTDVIQNPNSATGNQGAENMPIFQFNEEEHDFGKVIQGEKVSYSFAFKNIGKSDLLISSVSTSCGCTVPQYPKGIIHAGETKEISVSFDSEGKKGFQNKTISIVANTQPSTKILRIKANVIVPEE